MLLKLFFFNLLTEGNRSDVSTDGSSSGLGDVPNLFDLSDIHGHRPSCLARTQHPSMLAHLENLNSLL